MRFFVNYTLPVGEPGFDMLYVQASTDGGATWTTIATYQGDSGGWAAQTGSPPLGWAYNYGIDLNAFAGEEVQIRWRLVSDGEVVGQVQLDDIIITGKIDSEAPETTAIMNPPIADGCNGWYKSAVTVSLTATDNVALAETYYSIDGGAFRAYTGPLSINVDGEHTVSYYSVDSVGNIEPTQTISFKIDATAPTASITFPQSGYIYLMGRELFANPLGGTFIIGGITFSASASDATSGIDNVHFDLGTEQYDDVTSPYEIYWHKFDLLPADYTLTVTASDNACNTGSAATLSFKHWL
jgi:hypothetical protein